MKGKMISIITEHVVYLYQIIYSNVFANIWMLLFHNIWPLIPLNCCIDPEVNLISIIVATANSTHYSNDFHIHLYDFHIQYMCNVYMCMSIN